MLQFLPTAVHWAVVRAYAGCGELLIPVLRTVDSGVGTARSCRYCPLWCRCRWAG